MASNAPTPMSDVTIYTVPKVTVLAQTTFYNPLPDWETDASSGGEALAEFAGRLCYLSFGADVDMGGHKTVAGRQGNAAYLENIKKQGHGSVLEHASATMLFEQVSRSLTHELVRHRAGMSYSQLSQRYVDESAVGFVQPPAILVGSRQESIFRRSCERTMQSYQALLDEQMATYADVDAPRTMKLKWARESARSVLPNATETKIVVTGNGRSWRHFLTLRGNPGADREVRRLAVESYHCLRSLWPNILRDITVVTAPDGFEALDVQHRNV